jgi:hypothetical protein
MKQLTLQFSKTCSGEDGPIVSLQFELQDGTISFQREDGTTTSDWKPYVDGIIVANVQGPLDDSVRTRVVEGIEYIALNYSMDEGIHMRVAPTPCEQ